MTGRRVGCPSDPVVLSHVLEVQSNLDVYSIEKPGGDVVKVLVTATDVDEGIVTRQVGQGEQGKVELGPEPLNVGSPDPAGTGGAVRVQNGNGEHGNVGLGPGPLNVGRPTPVELDSLGSGTERLPVCPDIEATGKVVAVLPWIGTITEALAI
jgi:hypothetical protein